MKNNEKQCRMIQKFMLSADNNDVSKDLIKPKFTLFHNKEQVCLILSR